MSKHALSINLENFLIFPYLIEQIFLKHIFSEKISCLNINEENAILLR